MSPVAPVFNTVESVRLPFDYFLSFLPYARQNQLFVHSHVSL